MDQQPYPLADPPNAPEYAEDVTDLRTAQYMIAALRRKLAQCASDAEPLPNEYSVFLDEDRERKLQILFAERALIDDQTNEVVDVDDQPWLLEEAFDEFVHLCIDVRWDLVRDMQAYP
jgi:hypothetical protein